MTAAELKASILDLAVRGQLVPQDPKDKPADRPSDIDDPPYELPRNWVWKYGKEIGMMERGAGIKRNETTAEGYPCLRYGEIYTSYTHYLDNAKSFIPSDLFNACKHIKKNDLVFTLTGENEIDIAKTLVYLGDDEIAAGGDLAIWSNHKCYAPYLAYMMAAPSIIKQKAQSATGNFIVHTSTKKIGEVMMPLPPLPEQKRIVAKIEALLPLVEEYGEAQKELEALNADFPAALRESILQDAVQGNLTAGWRKSHRGESAADLLAQIAAERAAVGRARTPAAPRKKEKSLPPITDDEKPFEIPDTWAWCRLCNIIQSVGGRENQVLAKSVSPNGKFPVVSQGQSLVDGFSDDESKVVFDVPVIMFGDHTRNVKYVDFPFVIGADGTKFFKTASYPRWLYYWTVFQATQIGARGYGRHWGLLNEVLVALPPLAEQKAIVERVDELLKIVDAMKAQ